MNQPGHNGITDEGFDVHVSCLWFPGEAGKLSDGLDIQSI